MAGGQHAVDGQMKDSYLGRGNIEALRLIDGFSSAEFRLRVLVLGLPAVIVLLFYGLVFPILWVSAYFLALVIYQLLLRRMIPIKRDLGIRSIFFANFIVGLIFNGLAIHLWMTGERLQMLAATCLCLGTVLHSVAQRARLRWIIVGDALSNSSFFIVAATSIIIGFDTGIDQVIATVLMCAMLFYYAAALHEAYQMRARLREVSRRSAAAQKMEAIGRLTGGVAHDFNNILTVVSGNLELYKSTDDPAAKDQYAREASDAALRASALVSQLLAFSRQANLQPKSVALSAFLDSFWQMARRLLPEDISIIASVPNDQWPVLADSNQLHSALLNLVINARDAISGGGGELRLSTANLPLHAVQALGTGMNPTAQNYVQISVSDTGDGIPKAIMNRIFDPFFTTKEVGKGSGMGLSMAKGFAEQSGGALLVESEEGVGTIITLILPASPNVEISSPDPG